MGLVARGDEGRYYAVAPAVKGPPVRELRRPRSHEQRGDLEALWERLSILEKRLEELEERLHRLEEVCYRRRGGGGGAS